MPEYNPTGKSVAERNWWQQLIWVVLVWLYSLGLVLGTIAGPFVLGFSKGVRNVREYWKIKD